VFDRVTLAHDLHDCRGRVLGRRGFVMSAHSIADAAHRAPKLPRTRVDETPLGAELRAAIDAPALAHLVPAGAVRDAVERAIGRVGLPEVLYEELEALRRASPPLHAHALSTAVVSVRMLLAAAGEARGVPDLAAAALLHDLGMRHLPAALLALERRPTRDESTAIAAHPFLGAFHLASVLGSHPAVAAALSHHWRNGQGYPALAAAPSRAILVVGVASAFAALTQPRPFRSDAYDARGAADVLVAEAAVGQADRNTVRLLVHALRGGKGDPRAVRLGHAREGHAPAANRHAHVEPPPRAPV
jgi:HD-GYP domain-containing protein (c-di-GMP phosphodiesterase class II)